MATRLPYSSNAYDSKKISLDVSSEDVKKKLALIDAAKEQRVKQGLGIAPPNINTAPPLIRGIGSAMKAVGDVTGAFREGLGSTRPVVDIYRDRTSQPTPEAKRDFAQRISGVGGVVPSESRFTPSVGGVPAIQPSEAIRFAQNQPKAKAQLDKEAPSIQQAVTPKSIREMYASPREALMNMPDKEFKAFVDEHKHIPGIGYVESKGKIERVIPQRAKGGLPEMNTEQLQAYSDFLRAKSGEKQATTQEAGLGMEGRRADIESRKADIDAKKLEHEIASTDMKDPLKRAEMYQKVATAFGGEQYELDELGQKTGKSTVANYDAADELFTAMGLPVPKRTPKASQAKPATPKAGDVVKGYKFKGGNPADAKSWEKI